MSWYYEMVYRLHVYGKQTYKAFMYLYGQKMYLNTQKNTIDE